MGAQLIPGWYQEDPNKPTTATANLGTVRDKNNNPLTLTAVTDYSTGNVTYSYVYFGGNIGGKPIGLSRPLFTRSPSGAIKIYDDTYRTISPSVLTNLERNVSRSVLELNKNASQREQEELRNSNWYRSLANTPPAPPAKPQEGGDAGGGSSGGGSSGGGGAGGGTPQEPPKNTPEDTSKALGLIQSKPVRDTYGDLRYPKQLNSTVMDVVKFTMVTYVPSTFKKGTLGLTGLSRFEDAKSDSKIKKINGSVTLGIQPSIQDDNRVSWTPDDLGILGASGLEASLNIMNDGISGGKEFVKKLMETSNIAGDDIAQGVLANLAQAATGTKGVLARLGGAIVNPNLELLFTSPDLRSFSFTFKLSARDEDEAREIRKIIRFFKEGSAVQRSNIDLFLKAPNVFEIKYLQKEKNLENKSLNKIKLCALTSVSVDYTPMGSYMTFTDGSMVSYNMSLQFQELEPIYADDYPKDYGPNESVGY